jgi:hypothetical protein
MAKAIKSVLPSKFKGRLARFVSMYDEEVRNE